MSAVACVGVVIAVMDVSVAEEYLSGHCLVTPDKRLMVDGVEVAVIYMR